MSFVQRELDRLSSAMKSETSPERYAELYAAQQALAWVLEPDGFASPVKMIRGIPADLGGYQPSSNPDILIYFRRPLPGLTTNTSVS